MKLKDVFQKPSQPLPQTVSSGMGKAKVRFKKLKTKSRMKMK